MRIALTIAAFLLSALLPWGVRLWRQRRWGLPATLTVDPDDPQPADIAGYFAQIAQRLDAQPRRMRLAVDGRTRDRRALSLDFLPDGKMSVSVDGVGRYVFDLRRRWIPDHPVPLDLRRRRLYIDPVENNRFRVMDGIPFHVPAAVYACCSVLATVGVVWVVPECLAVACGCALGCITASRRDMV